MNTYLQILKNRNSCMQLFYTHWRQVKYPYLLATPLNLCQNNYWQNLTYCPRCFVIFFFRVYDFNFGCIQLFITVLFHFFVANFNVNLIFHFFHLDLKKNLMVLKLWPIWKKTPIRKSAFILFIFSACPWMGVNLVRF